MLRKKQTHREKKLFALTISFCPVLVHGGSAKVEASVKAIVQCAGGQVVPWPCYAEQEKPSLAVVPDEPGYCQDLISFLGKLQKPPVCVAPTDLFDLFTREEPPESLRRFLPGLAAIK